MRITHIEYFSLDLPLKTPYTIAYETVSSTTNIVLKITRSDGRTGWGCAAPDTTITGEHPEDVLDAIEGQIIPLLKGENPNRIAWHNQRLKEVIPAKKSSLAMVDIALYDLMARSAGLPLYELLGGYQQKIETSITIGILPLEATLEQARAYWRKGFRVIKLKGGLHLDEDVEKVIKLRELLGAELVLRFDANQGYDVEKAIRFMERTKKANIEILEQPTAFDNDKAMKKVATRVDVPVMADESIRSLKDAFRLSSNDIMDMANIKIMKVGGLLEGQHINSVAKAAGMEVMVGCLDECALGISAGLHFALSRPNIQYADLDGHLDLIDDPFTGLFRLENGWLLPTAATGLGQIAL